MAKKPVKSAKSAFKPCGACRSPAACKSAKRCLGKAK